MSHPTWVRGLKLHDVLTSDWQTLSHPTWVRGLKLCLVVLLITSLQVAPYVGAWIETSWY